MAEIQLLGLFHDVSQTANAIEGIRKLGVSDKQITVLSAAPYKSEILGRPKPSGFVGRMALFGALAGAALAAFLTAGVWLLYRLNQGSQPLIPIPPTLIVVFEVTMLGTMWTAFFGMLIANRFPVFKRRVYNVQITEDSIGVVAEVDETLASEIERVFKENGSHSVQQEPASPRIDAGNRRFWGAVLGGLVILTVIIGLLSYDIIRIPFSSQMVEQESIGFDQGPRLAAPPEAVPVQGPELIAGQPASQPGPATPASLKHGQNLFTQICVMCHGPGGKGNGKLSGFFNPKPFDLTDPYIQGLDDTELFLTLTQGFGPMPPMAENLGVQDRWDVINFVRTLK